MKLIFTILIVYFAYKVMFKPKSIDSPDDKKHIDSNPEKESKEYVDYEEVD